MGTIGGNVLDTRCLFYNQTEFWRKSLGYCLKAEGDWCHVIGGPKTCVAAQSSDTVPVLLAMDASITLLGPSGERCSSCANSTSSTVWTTWPSHPVSLLTHVRIPKPAGEFRGTYKKLRRRDSIDFPQLGVAVLLRLDGDAVAALDIVVGAVNPQPKPIRKLEPFIGQPLTDEAIDAIGALVEKQTRPQTSITGDPGWRRSMAGIFAARALRELRDA